MELTNRMKPEWFHAKAITNLDNNVNKTMIMLILTMLTKPW